MKNIKAAEVKSVDGIDPRPGSQGFNPWRQSMTGERKMRFEHGHVLAASVLHPPSLHFSSHSESRTIRRWPEDYGV
jgi:hypothetical protein